MAARKKTHSETDLYRPLADYLCSQGYTVRGEVHDCDIAAVKGDELIIVEMKLVLNLALVAQAAQRQKITDSVYIAVPRPSNKRQWLGRNKSVMGLLRRLEIGLILVSLTKRKPVVEVISHPEPSERHKRKSAHRAMLREIGSRSGDYNLGGSTRTRLVTAYREEAVFIAVCLAEKGPLSPRELRQFGACHKTQSILYSNFYKWFERLATGLYGLSPCGLAELAQYPEVVENCSERLSGLLLRNQPHGEPDAAGHD